MNFSEWLNKNEVLWRPSGVARGADYHLQQNLEKQQGLNPLNRKSIQQNDINQRISYGKGIEEQIFNALVECGLKLREPSAKEDMYDKIDAWWNTGTREEPMQIKYRDSGEDILFEVMKDYVRKIQGRDMIGKAVYYAVLTRKGEIVIVSVQEAKTLIKTAVEAMQRDGLDRTGTYKTNSITLKVRPDPASHQEKLMAYIPVSALKNVRPPCKVNF